MAIPNSGHSELIPPSGSRTPWYRKYPHASTTTPLVANTPGNLAAKKATRTVPIVMVAVGDPIRVGLVSNLGRPGGNITGFTNLTGEIAAKRLPLLKEAVPGISVVAMLWNIDPGQLASVALEEAKTVAKALGMQIRPYELKSDGDIQRAFDDLKKSRANALLITGGPVTTRNSKRIVELANKLHLPAMYNTRQFVEDGGLMAYGVNFGDIYRRAATYVDKILMGRKPADLPVEQPTKFEFIINLKAAKQIGLTIPPNVLARADKVIK